MSLKKNDLALPIWLAGYFDFKDTTKTFDMPQAIFFTYPLKILAIQCKLLACYPGTMKGACMQLFEKYMDTALKIQCFTK